MRDRKTWICFFVLLVLVTGCDSGRRSLPSRTRAPDTIETLQAKAADTDQGKPSVSRAESGATSGASPSVASTSPSRTAAPTPTGGQDKPDRTKIPMLPPASSVLVERVPAACNWPVEKRVEQTMLRMRKITLAMREYVLEHGHVPPTQSKKEGGAVQSWRVHLLPYLGDAELFAQFRRDEPWDSPANAELAKAIPAVYQSPFRDDERTTFLVPQSPLALFGSVAEADINVVTDSWSKTIALLMVDNELAVPWSQPTDFPLNDGGEIGSLGHSTNGFLAAFADADVRWIRGAATAKQLGEVFTIRGNELVELSDLAQSWSEARYHFRPLAAAANKQAAEKAAQAAAEPTSTSQESAPAHVVLEEQAVDTRTEAPNADQIANARAQLKQAFAKEIETLKGESKRFKHDFAEVLMKTVEKVAENDAAHFVLLETARDNAAESGDFTLSMDAADRIMAKFRVKNVDLLHDTIVRSAKSLLPHYGEQNDDLRKRSKTAVQEALLADNFEAAKDLAEVHMEACRREGDRKLIQEAQALQKEVEEVKRAFRSVPMAKDSLAAIPDDANANYVVGAYLAIIKGRWEKGLPFLAKGLNLRLRSLANEDMNRPDIPDAVIELANEYWDAADQQDFLRKRGLRLRAVYWYQQALVELPAGFNKVLAERRLDEAQKLYGREYVEEHLGRMTGVQGPLIVRPTN